jgi:predicted RNase H-like HicB family nuclease
MAQIYTAQIQHRGEWWIGWIREISGVNCQERTREELIETLKITLVEALEFEAEEAAHQTKGEYEVVKIAV